MQIAIVITEQKLKLFLKTLLACDESSSTSITRCLVLKCPRFNQQQRNEGRRILTNQLSRKYFAGKCHCYVSVKSKLQHAPPGHTPGI